jgi:hypothetical protein
MPFPLAHPAAVLPLRRFCPRRLSLAALMIGCLAPDASYLVSRLPMGGTRVSEFAHTFAGSLVLCLPAAGVMLLVFLAIRGPLAQALPTPHREAVAPLSRLPIPGPVNVLLSLLLGIWTHLLLDAATRESELLVANLPVFQDEMALLRNQGFQPYRLLWYALTAIGLGGLVVAYLCFLKRSTGSMWFYASWDLQRYVLWALILLVPGLVVLPFTLRYAEGWPQPYAVRHFFYVWSAYYLVAAGSTVVALGVILRAREEGRRRRPGP